MQTGLAEPATLAPTSALLPLSEGDAGTSETVREMCRLIDEGARDPEINRFAIAIVRAARVPQFDFEGERRAIYRWKLKNIRFIRDIEGKETLRSARETLTTRMGDCDCNTILTGALLKSIGQLVRIVTISSHPEAPDVFSHVFPEVRNERGQWISVDSARKSPAYARGPQHWFRRRLWDTDDGSWQDADAPDGASAAMARRPVFAGLGYLGAATRAQILRRRRLRGGFRGMGQDDGSGFDWSQLETELPALTTGTANIITAVRANPLNLVPNTGAASTTGLTPAAQVALAQAGYSTTGLSSSTLLLFGGAAILLVMLMGRK